MNTRTTVLSLAVLVAVAVPCFARVKLVLMPRRENVRIHYASGLALMEEERVVALEEGVNQVEMAWEGLAILPQSILFTPVNADDGLMTLALSTPPSGQSSLIWWVRSPEAGNYRLRISYALRGGLEIERIDYAARASIEEDRVALTGRARLYNGSGMNQGDLSVELGSAEPIRTSIERDERKDLLVLYGAEYPLEKKYVSDRYADPRVQLIYKWVVPVDGNPQLPGKARAFLATGAQQGSSLDTFLGESILPYVPRGEESETLVGYANNIEVERVLLDSRDENVQFTKVAAGADRQPERVLWDTAREWRITVKNHTDKDVTVRLVEHAVGEWEIVSGVQPTEVEDVNTFYIDVAVAAGEEKEVRYRIVQRNIEPGDQVLPS